MSTGKAEEIPSSKNFIPQTSLEEKMDKDDNYCNSDDESEPEMSCPKCNETFKLRKSLDVHYEKVHRRYKPHVCSKCRRRFESERKLAIHDANWHKEGLVRSPRICEICGKDCVSGRALRNHRKNHKKKNKPKVDLERKQCEECGKMVCPYRYVKHLEIHTSLDPYPCTLCTMRFTKKDDLKLHTFTHQGFHPKFQKPDEGDEMKKKVFGCDKCQKRFVLENNLEEHQRLHEENKALQCKHCKKCFLSQQGFTEHVKNTHTEEKLFLCSTCGKLFGTERRLTRHMRNHVEDGHYKCEHCPKEFTEKVKFNQHQKCHHEKSLSCTHCQTFFWDKFGLIQHMEIHARMGIQKF